MTNMSPEYRALATNSLVTLGLSAGIAGMCVLVYWYFGSVIDVLWVAIHILFMIGFLVSLVLFVPLAALFGIETCKSLLHVLSNPGKVEEALKGAKEKAA